MINKCLIKSITDNEDGTYTANVEIADADFGIIAVQVAVNAPNYATAPTEIWKKLFHLGSNLARVGTQLGNLSNQQF